LTRDVAYGSLPRPERRELHRRVGEWVQEVAPDRTGETVELAAYHFSQALFYGEDDPAFSRRAFDLLYAAEARLGPEDAKLRADALGLRSRVSWLAGRWQEALESATEAVAVLDGLPESPQFARALARLSQIEMLKQQPHAIETAEKAIAVARRVDDSFADVNARINIFTQRSTDGTPPDPDEVVAIIDAAVE